MLLFDSRIFPATLFLQTLCFHLGESGDNLNLVPRQVVNAGWSLQKATIALLPPRFFLSASLLLVSIISADCLNPFFCDSASAINFGFKPRRTVQSGSKYLRSVRLFLPVSPATLGRQPDGDSRSIDESVFCSKVVRRSRRSLKRD